MAFLVETTTTKIHFFKNGKKKPECPKITFVINKTNQNMFAITYILSVLTVE